LSPRVPAASRGPARDDDATRCDTRMFKAAYGMTPARFAALERQSLK
jgi:hypothetical protein